MGAVLALAVGMLWDFSVILMPTASVGMAPYPQILLDRALIASVVRCPRESEDQSIPLQPSVPHQSPGDKVGNDVGFFVFHSNKLYLLANVSPDLMLRRFPIRPCQGAIRPRFREKIVIEHFPYGLTAP